MAFSLRCKECGCYESSHYDPDFYGVACSDYKSPDAELERRVIADNFGVLPHIELTPRSGQPDR